MLDFILGYSLLYLMFPIFSLFINQDKTHNKDIKHFKTTKTMKKQNQVESRFRNQHDHDREMISSGEGGMGYVMMENW